MTLFLAFVVLAGTMALVPPVTKRLRKLGIWDHPNQRSSHSVPIVRGAGLAPALAAVIVFTGAHLFTETYAPTLLIAAVGFAALGLAEDVRGVPTLSRFFCQSLIAAAAVGVFAMEAPFPSAHAALVVALATVWVVGYVNVFNFMDGINGISVVQAILAGVGYGSLGWLSGDMAVVTASVILIAAAAGFLPFNFPSGSVFLGDVGSYFFGSWIAVLALMTVTLGYHPAAVLAPVAVYLADTAWTLLGRIRRGERWWEPHRGHVYQRLVRAGRTHAWTTAAVALLSSTCIVLGLTAAAGGARAVAASLSLLFVTATYLALPALVTQNRHE